jgi:hypothetical protein
LVKQRVSVRHLDIYLLEARFPGCTEDAEKNEICDRIDARSVGQSFDSGSYRVELFMVAPPQNVLKGLGNMSEKLQRIVSIKGGKPTQAIPFELRVDQLLIGNCPTDEVHIAEPFELVIGGYFDEQILALLA